MLNSALFHPFSHSQPAFSGVIVTVTVIVKKPLSIYHFSNLSVPSHKKTPDSFVFTHHFLNFETKFGKHEKTARSPLLTSHPPAALRRGRKYIRVFSKHHPDKMTDPRNIEFMYNTEHIKYHQRNGVK